MKTSQKNPFLFLLRRFLTAPTIVISFFGLARGATNTWTGATDSNWDFTTANWASPVTWTNGDAAVFNAGSGAVNVVENITLSGFTIPGASDTIVIGSGKTFLLDYPTAVAAATGGWSSKIQGPGTLRLNSAQLVNGSANWGPNSAVATPFSPSFTGALIVDKGRIDSSQVGLGGISGITLNNGAQFLGWTGTYTMPFTLTGDGWGESGLPGALRAAGGQNCVFSSNVTLAGDAGIIAQDATAVVTFNGSVGGTGKLTLYPKGKFNFNGTASESYTGGLNIVTTGGVPASSTITFNKPVGTVAVPNNSLVTFGTAGGSGQVNLRMSAGNQFGDNVRVDFNNPSGQWTRLDLMGTSQTLNGINSGTFTTQGSGIIQNREISNTTSNYGTSTLTLDGNTTDPLYPVGGFVFNSYLRDSDNGVSATNLLSIVKEGTGTQMLVGNVVSHSGTTTVNAGTLILSKTSALNTPIVNNATVELNAVAGDDWILNNGKALSGAGTWNKTGAGRASFNNTTVTASGQINILAGSLRNNNNSSVWSGSTADIDISSGATLDLFADAIYVDQLTGSGIVENGFGNATGSQSGASQYIEKLVAGVANGSSTFSGTLRNNPGNNLPNSGTTNGGGGLELHKMGSGTLTLNGTLSYTGITNINGGTLNIASATNNTLAGAVNGAGALVKSGNGILTLNGTNGLTGTTTVSGGSLAIGGTAPNTAISLATGANLRVNATGKTLSSVTMATGSSLELSAVAAQTTNVGTLALNSSPNITIKPFFAGAPLVGTYDVLTPTSITGTPASITTNFGSYDNARGVDGSTAITGGKLVLTVTGTFSGAANLVWNNFGGTGNWSVTTPADNNFDNGGSPDMFYDLDHVAFNGAATGTVNLPGPVIPASLTVNSSTGDYTFSGAGSITGATSLVKSGSSALTLATSNSYTGGITLNAGTLNANATASLGSGNLTLNGGLLSLGAANAVTGTPTVTFPTGSTTTLRLGGSPLTVTALNSGFPYVSSHTVESGSATPGSDTLTVNNATDNTFAGVLANGSTRALALAKGAAGTLTFTGSSSNTYTGDTTLTAGRIGLAKTGGAVAITGDVIGDNGLSPDLFATESHQFGAGSTMYFVNPTGDHFRFELLGTTQTLAGIENSTAAGRGVIQHREQVIPAAVSATSKLILNVPEFESYSYNGYLRENAGGTLALEKNGLGTQILSGPNITHSGGTVINAGEIAVGAANVGKGPWTINSGAILRATATDAIDSMSSITINAGGKLIHTFNGGYNQFYNSNLGGTILIMNGGSLESTAATSHANYGNYILRGNMQVGGSSTSVIAADLRCGDNADRTFTVNSTGDPSGIDLDITGKIGHFNGVSWGYLTKAGAGTMRFNNPALSSDVGRITVSAGKVIFKDSIAGMGNGGLVNNATVEVNAGPAIAVTYGGAMSGTTGILQKTGPGSLTLTNGATTFSGSIAVNGGLLSLPTRGASHGDISVATGATLRVTGITGTLATTGLNLANGSSLQLRNFTGNGSALLDVTTTNPVFTGTVPVEVPGITTTGTFPLVYYPVGGAVAGDGIAALSLVVPRSIDADLVDNTDNDSIDLTVNAINPVTWVGNEGSVWDTDGGNLNWDFDGDATAYVEGDMVLFDDTADTFAVTLDQAVAPAAVTFNNTANDFALSGAGAITGSAKLTKSGTGKLTITGAHTYTGGTQVDDGTLELGDGTTNGTLAGAIANEADVTFNNGLPQTLSTVISGTGSVTKTGAGVLTISSAQTYEGGTIVNQGTVKLFGTNNGVSSAGAGTLTINAGAIVESNSHNTLGQGTGTSLSPLVVNGGTFLSDAYTHINSITLTAGTIGVRSGVSQVDGMDMRTRSAVLPTLTSLASATASTVSSKISLNGNTTVTVADGGAASDLIISGAIVGASTLTKDGPGTLELAGTSTYGGATSVVAGTLRLNAGALGNTATTVANGATVAGSGTISGPVTVQGGGFVAPGNAGVGILATGAATLTGTYACEINGASADRVNVTGNLDVTGGTIAFSELAAPTEPGYIIATYTGSVTGEPVVTGIPTGYALDVTTPGQIRLVKAGYDTWATLMGLDETNNDPAFDADKDGVSNLMEYYLDGNPLASDPSIRPVATLNATHLTLTFKRRDDAEADMSAQVVDYGTNLSAWPFSAVLGAGPGATTDGNGVIVTVTEDTNNPDLITVQIPRTFAASGKLFARLKVTE